MTRLRRPDSTKPRRVQDRRGRTVLGGGGIVPDVVVPNRVVSSEDKALQEALGANVPQVPRCRRSTTRLALKTSGGVSSPEFDVHAAMRDELYRRLTGPRDRRDRGRLRLRAYPRDRALGGQITRFVFGTKAEYRADAARGRRPGEGARAAARRLDTAELVLRAREPIRTRARRAMRPERRSLTSGAIGRSFTVIA
jgi:hypothetical protein